MSTGPVRADPMAQRRERIRAPEARTRSFVAYGAVVAAIAAAMLAHLMVLPSLGIVAPLLPFIPAVLLGAWLGGLGPGLVATLLGAAAGGYVLLEPEFSIDAIARHEWLRLFLFVGSGAVISVIIEQMHRARRRAERLAAERRDAIVASRVSAERLAVILHHVPVGIGLLDRTGRFVMSNPVLDRLPLKVIPSADSAEAARWNVVDAAGHALARDMWPGARALRGDVVSPGLECEYASSSGERTWYSISAAPIRNDAGAVENAVIVVQDIDRLKRASEALEEADRRKDEFLATLAHELRNPLAPIWNAVEILGRHDPDPERRDEARRVIDRQVRHMVRLVDDLMDVSRITRDKLELRREAIELGALVEHAVETVRPRAEQSGVRIRTTPSSAPLTVLADPVRLTQVLTNVLNNAIKYSYANGTVSLVVEARAGHAVVTVQDEGIGFDAAEADRLFEMFSQSSPAIDHSQSGLGIGLWLSRRLMEMHGGTIDAQSAGRGQGSRFTLTLPLHEPTAAGASPAPRGDVPVQRFRVLVVDDNVDNAATLAELMAASGNEVAVAHDGEAALSAVGSFNPDVILLDIGLPRLDGYEVCRRVREERGGERLAILAMTGWGQAEDRRKSAAVGFDAHLVKPIDFQRLNEAVALASSQRGVRPEASRN